jgi:hypothetical protein
MTVGPTTAKPKSSIFRLCCKLAGVFTGNH